MVSQTAVELCSGWSIGTY